MTLTATAPTIVDASAEATPPRGRTSISSRALGRLASAVSANALGVDAARVGVDLTDERGRLVLTVKGPIRVVSLERVAQDETVVARTGGSVLARAAAAQGEIRSTVSELTGYQIARVVVQLSGADIRRESRVK
jgi:uncharacterized alkaline shock family protein YloU